MLLSLPLLWACQNNAKPVGTLLKELGSDDWLQRRNATSALSRAGTSAIPLLKQALKHQNPQVRIHAAEALAGMGAQANGAKEEIVSALKDKSPLVRSRAAQALGAIGGAAAKKIATLVHLLQDKNVRVRVQVLHALRKLDPKLEKTSTVLESHLKDPHPLAVMAAAQALATPPKKDKKKGQAPEMTKADEPRVKLAVKALKKLLQAKEAWLRASAAFTMSQLASWGKGGVGALLKALEDPDAIVRQNAADALGNIGEAATPKLAKALNGRSARTRYYVAYAIGKMGKQAQSLQQQIESRLKAETDRLVKKELKRTLARVTGKRIR